MKASKKLTKTKPAKASKKVVKYPRSAGDVFATQKMLYSVRDEVIAHTEKKFQQTEVRFHELKSEIHEVKVVIHEVKSEIHGVKSEIHGVKSEVHGLKAQISQLDKSMHRIALQVEEQNNRNKIVLDGLSQLFERQERIEKKVDSSL